MSEGMDQAGSTSGASTPTSPFFDPSASDFVPKRTPATDGRTASGQLRAAFNTMPGPSPSDRKAVRPGLPLFTSSTWSPSNNQPIRSAGIPPKSSWESFHNRIAGQAKASPTTPGLGAGTLPGPYLNSPLSGRGTAGNFGGAPHGDDGQSSTRWSPESASVRYTQTKEYHNTAPMFSPHTTPQGSFVSHTAPLPQEPFFHTGGAAPASSSGGSNASEWPPIPSTPNSSASSFATQPFNEQHSSDDMTSPASGSVAISDHYSKTHPEQTDGKAEVWAERHNNQSLRRALKDPHANWEEAYSGALAILNCMNPETYQMPFGTRVINIKTEYPRNILLSLKHGKYSVMAKVAERITKVWEAREKAAEKVLFLFSVNGSKKFCGVAEMSGAWDRDDSIAEWESNPESAPCVGTIPIVWVFVKDVSYHNFIHITQPHSSNPVGNMWNGMNFPSATGREVMESYVKVASTSSILGLPRAYRENEGLPHASTANRPGNYNSRSSRGGRGVVRGGHAVTQRHWRPRNNSSSSVPVPDEGSDADQTPTAGSIPWQRASAGPPPKYNSTTRKEQSLDSIQKGQLLSVVVNNEGKLEVVAVGANPGDPSSSSNGHGTTSRTGFVGVRGRLQGARSHGILHHSDSSTSTLRGQNERVSQRVHPVASMGNVGPSQGSWLRQRDGVSPLAATWSSFEPGQANPVRSPGAANVVSPAGLGKFPTGEGTPTHRPASRASRRTEDSRADESEGTHMNVNSLKAKFHGFAAEQYSLQAQFEQPDTTEAQGRVLSAKMARILSEKRMVQARLNMMGVHLETTSPLTRDSFSSTEPESESSESVDQISPVRAEDGRRLRSISKLESPLLAKDGDKFDKAPGGSDRRRRHKPNPSSDMQKRSITDLIDSPKVASTPARLNLRTSAFFPETITSPCERRAFKLATPLGIAVSESTSPRVFQNSSFPTDPTKANGQGPSSAEPGTDGPARPNIGGVRLNF